MFAAPSSSAFPATLIARVKSTFNDSTTGDPELDQLAAGQASTGAALARICSACPILSRRYFTGSNFYPGLRQTRLFFFGQDSWRVTPKLTLNYGLRWEDYLPQIAAKPGGAGSFDPSTGEVLAAGIGTVPRNMGVKPYNLGFAPRLGIAYQATPKTVIRTGFGMSFNPSGLGSGFRAGYGLQSAHRESTKRKSQPNPTRRLSIFSLVRRRRRIPCQHDRPLSASGWHRHQLLHLTPRTPTAFLKSISGTSLFSNS